MADDRETRVAVIYYSATGNVHGLAQAVTEGAEEAGAEVRLRHVALCQATLWAPFRTRFCERLRRLEQQAPRAEARCSNRGAALQQEGPAAGQMLRLFVCFHNLLLPEFASPRVSASQASPPSPQTATRDPR